MDFHRIKKRVQGTAILVAIMVVSIAAATAIMMDLLINASLRRTQLMLASDKLYGRALYGEAWAVALIPGVVKAGVNKFKPQQYQLTHKFPEDGSEIQSEIIDQVGLYNLNYLADLRACKIDGKIDEVQQNFINQVFIRMLENLPLASALSEEQAKNIVGNINAWFCPPGVKTSMDSYYAGLNNSYQRGQQLMLSISELKLVRGITRDIFLALQDQITALPVEAKLTKSIGTVPVLHKTIKFSVPSLPLPILAALANQSTAKTLEFMRSLADQSWEARAKKINQFILDGNTKKTNPAPNQAPDPALKNVLNDMLMTKFGSYNLVKTKIQLGEHNLSLYSMLQWQESKAEVIWRSQGTY